jgi:uncharacterized protein YecE (DUF72 family)
VRGFAHSGHDVYLYFNNTKGGDGAADARDVRRWLDDPPRAAEARGRTGAR